MPGNEAIARIKINKLLEDSGWRFFAEGNLPANIQLEPSITIKETDLDGMGENFEKTSKGYIDFLLLNSMYLQLRIDILILIWMFLYFG